MSSRDLVSAFWVAMQADDWDKTATYLAPECVIDWPCSGERIVRQIEYWPTAYEPLPGREDLTRPIDRVP
jgi:hypothetical protein